MNISATHTQETTPPHQALTHVLRAIAAFLSALIPPISGPYNAEQRRNARAIARAHAIASEIRTLLDLLKATDPDNAQDAGHQAPPLPARSRYVTGRKHASAAPVAFKGVVPEPWRTLEL